MIRNLSAGLGISAEALIQEYPLVESGLQTKPQPVHYPASQAPARQVAEGKPDQGE
jgi:hypothetical protein